MAMLNLRLQNLAMLNESKPPDARERWNRVIIAENIFIYIFPARRLVRARATTQLDQAMPRPTPTRSFRRNPRIRFGLFLTGLFLIIISPIIGILPGPGFIILFPIGLMLCLQNSNWAKRVYVRGKRRYPRYGAWTDRAMRRASAARRAAKKQWETLTHDD